MRARVRFEVGVGARVGARAGERAGVGVGVGARVTGCGEGGVREWSPACSMTSAGSSWTDAKSPPPPPLVVLLLDRRVLLCRLLVRRLLLLLLLGGGPARELLCLESALAVDTHAQRPLALGVRRLVRPLLVLRLLLPLPAVEGV